MAMGQVEFVDARTGGTFHAGIIASWGKIAGLFGDEKSLFDGWAMSRWAT